MEKCRETRLFQLQHYWVLSSNSIDPNLPYEKPTETPPATRQRKEKNGFKRLYVYFRICVGRTPR